MGLNKFLDKFGYHFTETHGTVGSYKSIDPLNTFTCEFTKFSPTPDSSLGITDNSKIKTIYDKIVNTTFDFKMNNRLHSYVKITSFDVYVQDITLPRLTVQSDESIQSVMGTFPTHKLILTPDTSTFTLNIINTGNPILETFFLPWMREIQSPQWVYKSVPYTKATFKVNMQSHTDLIYVFLGCRPTEIDTVSPSQSLPSSITRKVTITFDLMYVETPGSDKKNNSPTTNNPPST